MAAATLSSAAGPSSSLVEVVFVLFLIFVVIGLGHRAGLDEDPLEIPVPAERQRAGPERFG